MIRISGPETINAITAISKFKTLPKARYVYLRNLYHPETNELIDKGLVLWFPGPHSFTGEDSCEFQIHGGPAIIECFFDALTKLRGYRPAAAGEFTKRAFYNSKLDLTEAEGLADLIHSETEFQRKQALIQANGALSALYRRWRSQIIKNIAHMEAFIDFSEDENIEDNVLHEVTSKMKILETEIHTHLNDKRRGERLRMGARAAIIGAPNVGKSSFLNLVCHKPISIVTNIAGTTRDIIESHYNIDGYPVILADTAGLRSNSKDLIELEGMTRARDYAKQADFIILILDIETVFSEISNYNNFESYKKQQLLLMDLDDHENTPLITILNKSDLLTTEQQEIASKIPNSILMSCKSLMGHDHAINTLRTVLVNICGNPNKENPVISHARHRHLLEETLEHTIEFNRTISEIITGNLDNIDFAILTQKLRCAMRSLGKITGEVSCDEILDVIFKDFCIGK